MRLGKKQHGFSCKIKKHARRKAVICFLTALLLLLTVYTFRTIRPTFARLAQARAKELAVAVINREILSVFSEREIALDTILSLHKDSNQSVHALQADLTEISMLKADLNLKITKALAEIEEDVLKIPLGSLTGNDLLAGVGPSVSFRVKPYGTAVTDVVTDFSEAGINQSKLDISVDVKTNFSILMPTMKASGKVETTVPVFSTVIVGEVPQSYTNVDRYGFEYEEDVLELAE